MPFQTNWQTDHWQLTTWIPLTSSRTILLTSRHLRQDFLAAYLERRRRQSEVCARLDDGPAIPAQQLALHPHDINGATNFADVFGVRGRLVRLPVAHHAAIVHHTPTMILANAVTDGTARTRVTDRCVAWCTVHPAIAAKAAMATVVPLPKARR